MTDSMDVLNGLIVDYTSYGRNERDASSFFVSSWRI
jgi:hypothetical protein